MRRRVSYQYANARRLHWRAQGRTELAVENREGPGGRGWGQQRGRTAVRGTVERACPLLMAAGPLQQGSAVQPKAPRQPDLPAQKVLSAVAAPGQGWRTGKLCKARELGVKRKHGGAWKSWDVRLRDRQTGGD